MLFRTWGALVFALGALGADPREGGAIEASLDRPWQWRSYALAAGLVHQRVFDLTFSPDGTVWCAASNGLWRYDGYAWTRFGTEAGLPSQFVRSVLMSASGELWVGTDAGAGVFDPERRAFDRRGTGDHLPNNNVRQIVQDPDGTLWFACDQWPDTSVPPGGLASLRDGRWTTYGTGDGLPIDYVIGYHRDRDGRRFALTPRGWANWSGHRWVAPPEPGADLEKTVLHLAEDANGRLFAQGETHLLTLGQNGWEPLAASSVLVGDTRDGRVLALTRDAQRGTLLLCRWDGERFAPLSSRLAGPRSSRFYHMREAPDGAIWCVGEGLVLRWSREQETWAHFSALPSPLHADARGRVWFGGEAGVWWSEKDAIHPLPALSEFFGVEPDGTVIGRAVDGDWVSVGDPAHAAPRSLGLGLGETAEVAYDFSGKLWLRTMDQAGDMLFAHRGADGSWRVLGDPRLKNRRVVATHPDNRGGLDVVVLDPRTTRYEVLWVSSDGVAWIDLGEAPPPIPYPQYYRVGKTEFVSGYDQIYRRDAGAKWVRVNDIQAGAFTQVLLRRNSATIFFKGGKTGEPGVAEFRDDRWRVTPGDYDFGVRAPHDPRLRIATAGGIYIQADADELAFDFLALPEDALIQSFLAAPNGDLWIATSDGVLRHRAGREPPDTRLRLRVTELRGGGLPVQLAGVSRFDGERRPESWRYAWRFDDGPWSRFQTRDEIAPSVDGLPVGAHVLEVKARDSDGRIDPTPARAGFYMLSVPLQERAWFPYALLALAAWMGALLWIGVSRARAIRSSNAALKREIAERQTAEAALRLAHAELEKRVAERTVELSTSNASLRHALDERARNEAQRDQLELQLREAQKMQAIGTLAGGIAHDFNNILTVIIPCAQLSMKEASAAQHSRLTMIVDAAQRARMLVQQILAFSRRQKHEFVVVDPASIITEAMQLFRSALPAGIQLKCRIAPQTPDIFADPTHLHQVLMNLCTNAHHALHRHGGEIVVSLDSQVIEGADAGAASSLRPGVYVRLSVTDNGTGMEPAVRERVFEPFFTTKEPGRGTGLGLAVVHGIVKEHKGSISIRSEPGVGTTVEVLLPACFERRAEPGPAALREARGGGQNILLIDDEPAVLDTLSHLLRHAGYTVLAFSDPVEALAAFHAAPSSVDLVITDLTMPNMNGIELCREIRRVRTDLPLLVLTGFDGNLAAADLATGGFDDLITKPFDSTALLHRIHELLERPKG